MIGGWLGWAETGVEKMAPLSFYCVFILEFSCPCWEWGRPPVRKRSHQYSVWKEEPAYGRYGTTFAQREREREREREAQNGISLFSRMQQLQE